MGSLGCGRASGYIKSHTLRLESWWDVISAARLTRMSFLKYQMAVILNLQNTWVQYVDTWSSLSLPFLAGC